MAYLGVFALLSLLILIHELGHLAAARLVGIPIEGFSVGLGPKLWARRWGRTEYSLRAIPLGGFVVPAVADDCDFRMFVLGKRLAFYFGGPLAKLATALALFGVLNMEAQGFSFHAVLIAAWPQVTEACWNVLLSLSSVFAQPESLSGVFGIVVEGGRLAAAGMIVSYAISLSISLAVFNLLPIPVLDGGQIVLSCLEEMSPRLVALRTPLTLLGLVLVGGLMVYANGLDVARYWF